MSPHGGAKDRRGGAARLLNLAVARNAWTGPKTTSVIRDYLLTRQHNLQVSCGIFRSISQMKARSCWK